SAGKVALVSNQFALSGACPTSGSIIDLVGYGSTNCSETTAAIAPSATTAVFRQGFGCMDSNSNAADFTAAAPSPRSAATTPYACGGALNESRAAGEVDYCTTQDPLGLSVAAGATVTIFGRIYENGLTNGAGASPRVTAQFGLGPATANPQYEAGWSWTSAHYNPSCLGCGAGDDEYAVTIAAPVGTYRYGYRFSLDSGSSWTYCDNRQGDGGAGSNVGLQFNLEDLGSLSAQ
ncbi:MAG: hypothetical protein HY901_12810, partial [Deltaproteobacteria bacterium]|nr:hypothetical protein [Deltaproteobacteria bacterium]